MRDFCSSLLPLLLQRVVLLAAKHGRQLPEPPQPRYALPAGTIDKPRRRVTDTGAAAARALPAHAATEWVVRPRAIQA
jgi:hypothetical protein